MMLARSLDLTALNRGKEDTMKQGTFVTILGLALAASAIAAGASTSYGPAAQATPPVTTPIPSPSGMASMQPMMSPSPMSTMKPS